MIIKKYKSLGKNIKFLIFNIKEKTIIYINIDLIHNKRATAGTVTLNEKPKSLAN